MGISVLTTRAEYNLMEVFRAIAYDINDRMNHPKSPADDAIIARNERAIDKLIKWQSKGKDTLVTKFAVPTEPVMGGNPSLDIVSQILNKKKKPKCVSLE